MFIKVSNGYARACDISLVRQFSGVTYVSVRGHIDGGTSEVTTHLSIEDVLDAIQSAKEKE